ncbi:MAG: bifunctional N-acetylglucosamine-1-phosphate uridyltransferase/glucosamine-1-phosphate acetyltransferase, partial [Acidobacteriota bacterium]
GGGGGVLGCGGGGVGGRGGAFCLVGTRVVEGGAEIGPFSRLRMENHVGEGAQIGNFVELKKTRFGAGSKAMHLAYLGDSDIGAGVNIGAGTITCNYDGVAKHRTEIGEGVFVGSNSTLVAPVRIEGASYVAAGSVITETVPREALALGRSRQTVKPGWVKRRRGGE